MNENEDRKKKVVLTRGKAFLILFVLIIINVFVFIILNITLTNLSVPIEENEDKILNLHTEISSLRTTLNQNKTSEECEIEIKELESKTISLDILFSSEYSEPIKIDSICTECVIRKVGRVKYSNDIPEEFRNLNLITVRTNEWVDEGGDLQIDGDGDVDPFYNLLVNTDYSLIYLPKYFIQDEGTFSESVSSKINKNLQYNKEYFFSIGENSTPKEMDYDSVLEGKRGLYYEYGFFTGFTLNEFQKDISLKSFDIYDGRTIYVDSDNLDNYYIANREHYMVFLKFYPSIQYDAGEDGIYPIIWNDETINTSEYTYGYEGCGGDFSLDSGDIPKEKLEIAGYTTKTNQPIYQYLDKQEEALKTFYDEYLEFLQGWEDENLVLTYEEFVKSHPLIFWEDETGRMIEFTNSDFLLVGGCAKPIVYLYPEKQTDITVKVLPTNGELTFTYPRYDGQWNVSANRNGLLKDKDGNQYEYLWWESKHNLPLDVNKGFVVKNHNLATFFDLILGKAGFLQNEINDFKEFWIPTMNKEYSPYFKISFLQNQQVDEIAKLSIFPEPNTEIRIFMVYERLNSYIDITPQDITQTDRKGFVVTEWGGTRR